jgi:hypothetical protein
LSSSPKKTRRVLDASHHIALDQRLDELTSKKYAATEFLATMRPKFEKALSLGYSHKQLAEIVSETTGVQFTSADVKRGLAKGRKPAQAKQPKAPSKDELTDEKLAQPTEPSSARRKPQAASEQKRP